MGLILLWNASNSKWLLVFFGIWGYFTCIMPDVYWMRKFAVCMIEMSALFYIHMTHTHMVQQNRSPKHMHSLLFGLRMQIHNHSHTHIRHGVYCIGQPFSRPANQPTILPMKKQNIQTAANVPIMFVTFTTAILSFSLFFNGSVTFVPVLLSRSHF